MLPDCVCVPMFSTFTGFYLSCSNLCIKPNTVLPFFFVQSISQIPIWILTQSYTCFEDKCVIGTLSNKKPKMSMVIPGAIYSLWSVLETKEWKL